jgi:hypothetical protein
MHSFVLPIIHLRKKTISALNSKKLSRALWISRRTYLKMIAALLAAHALAILTD